MNSGTVTIKARAFLSGWVNSDVGSATYTIVLPKVTTPTLSPSTGTYTGSVTVSISCATSAAVIRYTIDGTQPNSASALYTVPFVVASTVTVTAKAFMIGMTDSDLGSATYTIVPPKVTTPIISLSSGSYTGPQTVTITCSIGAAIHYTTDGSQPTFSSTLYRGSITISNSLTLIAKAFYSGWTDSDPASATYTILTQKAATPVITPPTGTYSGSQIVAIKSSDGIRATIHYTENGDPATASSPVYIDPFIVSSSETVKAIAIVSGMDPSDVASETITINPLKVSNPVIAFAAATSPGSATVYISCSTVGAVIRYTTNGAAPTSTSPLYTGS